MNRLEDSGYDGRKESFTYDKVGNRLTKTTNDTTDSYVYNVKNQLKELRQDSGTNHFTYDKQGNTIKEETQVGNNSYKYNNLNQQVKAITKEGNTLVSRYDTEGLRSEIEENEKLTKFIFHKENVLVETDKDYNLVSRFTRGYEVVAADIADNTEENRYYYAQDEQGSTGFITDKEQQIKNEYCYDAFGNVLESTKDVHNRITYTGQQFDGITNQYYLRARFYNPVIGRFTQEDVYRGDGLNLYSYCGSNPVGYYDPSGYSKRECPQSKTQAINDTNIKGKTEIIWPSKPHKNGTEGHWETIINKVDNMSESGKYNKIYINKGIGNEIPGAKPNNRPDIMGVRKNGKIDQIEVPSKTDTIEKLIKRMEINKNIMGDRAGTAKIKKIRK
ncbi:RHS repeat domain-containing protein [Clostridium estertheticum]|uniref:RHS repeat domain-containing protein n=1 Tax=Clostridium estertheticum TaxID=238834 RepID=UPI001CF14140|nr:RHS repeat-associated core domain-containing protein [Clostridium estertheticum]MCB2355763.1 RHS repeat-associated core domain-containing protein [Clostridium estertheticum]WAG39349.1 RHS repeat-associated core domain-containing protein [Clostridium estertheticum]